MVGVDPLEAVSLMGEVMKRGSVLATMLFLLSLLVGASAHAKILPMGDEALARVTGQAGIAISVSQLGFDIKADTIYYQDADGIGPGTGAGFLSLCGVQLKGSADFATPMTINVATDRDSNGATHVTGVVMKISDMTLKIDNFYIDAIRLGSAPGLGGSLGSFGINNMVVKLTGGISINAN